MSVLGRLLTVLLAAGLLAAWTPCPCLALGGCDDWQGASAEAAAATACSCGCHDPAAPQSPADDEGEPGEDCPCCVREAASGDAATVESAAPRLGPAAPVVDVAPLADATPAVREPEVARAATLPPASACRRGTVLLS